MRRSALLCLVPLLAARPAFPGCTLSEEICTEGPETRMVSGMPVTRSCWKKQRRYTCTSGSASDTCAELANAGCSVKSSECTASAGTACAERTYTYACRGYSGSGGAAKKLSESYTFTDTEDTGACARLLDNPSCRKTGRTCAEPGGTRTAGATTATRDCWAWTDTYACTAGSESDACAALYAQGCTLRKAEGCAESTPGGCRRETYVLACPGTASGGETIGQEIHEQEDASSCPESDECVLASQACATGSPCTERIRTYSCTARKASDTCSELSQDKACRQQSESCADGACTRTYACQADTEYPNAERVSRTETPRTVAWEDCSADTASCERTASVCTDDTSGTCTEWADTWTCATGRTEDGCAQLASAGCSLFASQCLAQSAGRCTLESQSWSCPQEPRVVEKTVCSGSGTLVGVRVAGDDAAGTALASSLTGLEAAREAAVYGDVASNLFFSGTARNCSRKLGIHSCCGTKVRAAASNSAWGVSIAYAAEGAGEVIKAWGSPFVYDALAGHAQTAGLLSLLYGDAASGAYAPSLSFWGFSASWAEGGLVFGFDPASFALAAAAAATTAYLACSAGEQSLAVARGAQLCHYVGSYCAKKTPFGCIESGQSYCCFNSRLALAVQESARTQLSLSWGSGRNPACGGLAIEQLRSIDWSLIDTSAISAEIAAAAEIPETASAAARAAAALDTGSATGALERSTAAGTLPTK